MLTERRIPCRRLVLGLGSNLGDRAANLRRAADLVAAIPGVEVLERSSVLETPPAGGPAQADYLNAALLVATELTFAALLEATFAIERELGRVRPDPIRWGPRTIDIDLLWCEGESSDDPATLVPHPRLASRAFALQPLLELCPDATEPRSGHRYADLPAATEPVRRIGSLEATSRGG
jgi:2-amino-4-hydroxy-6-hydroxymethyldihydropteridine diphosphokinase